MRVARGIGNTLVPVPVTTFATGAALTITTASPGFVLVNAAITYATSGGSCPCQATVRLRDTATGGAVSPDMYTLIPTPNATATLSPTYVFPATAGSHTYMIEISSNVQYTYGAYGVITALFVPFAQDGGTTLAP